MTLQISLAKSKVVSYTSLRTECIDEFPARPTYLAKLFVELLVDYQHSIESAIKSWIKSAAINF